MIDGRPVYQPVENSDVEAIDKGDTKRTAGHKHKIDNRGVRQLRSYQNNGLQPKLHQRSD